MDYSKFRLRSFTIQEPYCQLDCGSNYELPLKYISYKYSDVDALFYCYDICAIPWNRNPPRNTRCTILRIDSTETPAGYARLIVDGNRTHDMPSYYRRPGMLDRAESGGPSIQNVDRCSGGFRKRYKPGHSYVCTDKLFAICCPYWPVEAEEWRKRKRVNGWPNEKLIARITRGGCHFVSKLRTWSSCDDTEWRFSFSKAELLLIHSCTEFQKFVYHIIRFIKNRMSKDLCCEGTKVFKTYYFKTLMFWACEKFSPKFWSEQNLDVCRYLFHQFYKCLNEKFCPNYFIPECNIMSDLKDGGGYQTALEALRKFLTGREFVCDYVTNREFYLSGSLENECLEITRKSFPITENLNGRFGEYLSECEWFLPQMKCLHSAIEAHLRLMSIDNVASRKEGNDYVECLENFKSASIRNEDFESYNYANLKLSFYEIFNAILIRKQSRNSIPVYHRSLRKSFKDDAHDQMVKESFPPSLFCTASAYRANFNFTAMQSYKESLTECDECLDIMKIANYVPRSYASHIPVLICNSLSQIYDEHLQVILGFITLHRNIYFSESSNFSTAHEVCLKLDAIEFVKYLRIQCGHKLSVKPVEVLWFPYIRNSDFEVPCLSQLVQHDVFSAAILFAALRQSRVSKEHVPLIRIPRYCSEESYFSAFQFSNRMDEYMQNSLAKTPEYDHPTHALKALDLLN